MREQLGKTRSAALGLVAAHIQLARAEFSEIIGEIKKAAMFGSIALGLIFVAATILTVGSILWLDEWWFGSMGWGVLHGTELFVALAILFVLAIIDLSFARAVGSLVVGLVFGIAVGIVMFANWKQIADSNLTSLTPEWRAVIAAIAGGAVVLGVLGLLCAVLLGGGRGAAVFVAFLIGGAAIGWLVGALAPTGTGAQIAGGVAVGLAFLIWPIFAAILVFRHGIDTEKLKDRFTPDQTIQTTKETIEWVRAQTPLGRKS